MTHRSKGPVKIDHVGSEVLSRSQMRWPRPEPQLEDGLEIAEDERSLCVSDYGRDVLDRDAGLLNSSALAQNEVWQKIGHGLVQEAKNAADGRGLITYSYLRIATGLSFEAFAENSCESRKMQFSITWAQTLSASLPCCFRALSN